MKHAFVGNEWYHCQLVKHRLLPHLWFQLCDAVEAWPSALLACHVKPEHGEYAQQIAWSPATPQ